MNTGICYFYLRNIIKIRTYTCTRRYAMNNIIYDLYISSLKDTFCFKRDYYCNYYVNFLYYYNRSVLINIWLPFSYKYTSSLFKSFFCTSKPKYIIIFLPKCDPEIMYHKLYRVVQNNYLFIVWKLNNPITHTCISAYHNDTYNILIYFTNTEECISFIINESHNYFIFAEKCITIILYLVYMCSVIGDYNIDSSISHIIVHYIRIQGMHKLTLNIYYILSEEEIIIFSDNFFYLCHQYPYFIMLRNRCKDE